MALRRNDPCPCGSGEKYKRCCEERRRSGLSRGALVLGLLVVFGTGVTVLALLRGPDGESSGTTVWSEEHGHWHDVAPGPDGFPATGGAPVLAPSGPPPPGRVWSAEHGHWHDVAPGSDGVPATGGAPVPAPPGPPPAGKVWSADHGHWHDAPQGTVTPP